MTFQAKTIENFGRRLRALAHDLWEARAVDLQAGRFPAGLGALASWSSGMTDALYIGYEQAWTEGERAVGILPEERTLEEIVKLQSLISDDLSRILPLGDFIVARDKASGGPFAAVLSRVELWTNRYNSVKHIAQITAGADRKMRWRVGPTEHCQDCAGYDGRVYRASVWAKYNAIPQSRSLECGGWKCQCRFDDTSAPVNSGHPPFPSGG